MKVIEVASKQQIKEFLKLPYLIYQNDSNWIPHIKQDIEKVFNPAKNKAFRHGVITRWILLDDNGKTIGRVAAFINKKTCNTFKQPTGGMGFYECIDDKEASILLLATAKNWLKEQGMEAMDGPINFGEKNLFWGLLTDNYTDPNSYGMNYNLPYYKNQFEDFGFKLYYQQFMFKLDFKEPVQESFTEKYERIKKDKGYRIANIEGMELDEVAANFRKVYNSAWGGHDNFMKMDKPTSQGVFKSMKQVIDKKIVIFVYYKEEPIAFYINIPELNEIFKYVNGNLNWLGKAKVLYHQFKKTPKTMVGIVFGVAKEFQSKGVEGALIKWAEENIISKTNYEQTVLTWIGDFNPKMLHVCENLGANVYRTYQTYRYLFDENAVFERAPIID